MSSLSNDTFQTDVIRSCIQNSTTAFLTGGCKLLPWGLAAGIIAYPLLKKASSIAKEKIPNLQATCISTLSRPLQERATDFLNKVKSNQEHVQTISKTWIIGQRFSLSAASFLLLPFTPDPLILLAQPDRNYVKVDLSRLDTINCTSYQRNALRMARALIGCKQKIFGDASVTVINLATYLALTKGLTRSRCKPLEIAIAAATAFYFLALASKLAIFSLYADKLAKAQEVAQDHFYPPQSQANSTETLSATQPLPAPSNPSQEIVSPQAEDPIEPIHGPIELSLQERHVKNLVRGLGILALLPTEILVQIMQFLPDEEVDKIAKTSVWFSLICRDKQFKTLRKQFGDDIVDAIGPQLLTAPWYDLQTTLVCDAKKSRWEPEKYDDNLYDNVLRSNWKMTDETWREPLKDILGVTTLNDLPEIHYLHFKIKNGLIQTDDSFLNVFPHIQYQHFYSSGCIFFINPTDLKDHKIVKFKDSSTNRYGVAFQYLFTYSVNKKTTKTAPGVAILHQLRSDRKEYVWNENQAPHQGHQSEKGYIYKIWEDALVLKELEGSSQRNFLFIDNTKTPSTQNHLNWLKKFVAGHLCRPLFHGREMSGAQYPTLIHQVNHVATSTLIKKELAALLNINL